MAQDPATRRPHRHRPLVSALALTVAGLLAAVPSSAATTRRCGETVAEGPPGYSGYALIVSDVRATGTTCATARRVGRGYFDHRIPRGWRCVSGQRIRCHKGSARVSFVFGGDAGR